MCGKYVFFNKSIIQYYNFLAFITKAPQCGLCVCVVASSSTKTNISVSSQRVCLKVRILKIVSQYLNIALVIFFFELMGFLMDAGELTNTLYVICDVSRNYLKVDIQWLQLDSNLFDITGFYNW